MLLPETALRLIVIGQLIMVAFVMLVGKGSRAARLAGAMLLVGAASYLVLSGSVLHDAVSPLQPALMLPALVVPYSLWLFARAVFEAPWPRWWIVAAFVTVALVSWVAIAGAGYFETGRATVAEAVMRVASLCAVAHALYITVTGRPDDLVEKRRRFRMVFVIVIAVQVIAVTIVELTLGAVAPSWLVMTNVVVIAAMTLGLAIIFLRLNPDFISPVTEGTPERRDAAPAALSAAEAVLRDSLDTAMADGGYRQSGLTIKSLAEQLGCPEHRLRKLVNGHLGYRNFSSYLNSLRIPEAQRALADPAKVRTPILTIALDLGYGSLGPFNRAFKAMVGTTPSAYRQTRLGARRADSE